MNIKLYYLIGGNKDIQQNNHLYYMKVLAINSYNNGSTGNIMHSLADVAKKLNIDYYTASPYSRSQRGNFINHFYIGNRLTRNMHVLLGRFTGMHGFFSMISTIIFIKKIKKLNIDLIHLHNLHGDYINIGILFKFIKKNNIPVIWTLHDCWSMTGQCVHFSYVECDRWKYECFDCCQCKYYPRSYIDNSKRMWKYKKKIFTDVSNMQIVTPSKWLKTVVKNSYLKEYKSDVIYNGIDLKVFYPRGREYRNELNIKENDKVVLFVSFSWGERKGLDVINRLYKNTGSDYTFIVVGTDDEIDNKLDKEIIKIHRTENQDQLAKLYSISDVFVNPTREEVLGMVNIEALACGTPVVTFDSGGSPECIDKSCGIVVKRDDYIGMENAINYIFNNPSKFKTSECVLRAQMFNKFNKYNEYINLYFKKLSSKKGWKKD